MNSQNRSISRLRLFGTVRVLVISALLIAMSIALGKLLAFNIGNSLRVSFENLPILMAGIFFGPAVGLAVGAGADIIGCLIVGYSINPLITLGAGCIGLVSGLAARYLFRSNKLANTAAAVANAHIIGSMIVKSVGLYIYYHTPVTVLLLRIPLYIGIGLLEFYIIYLLLKNRAFSEQLDKVRRNG